MTMYIEQFARETEEQRLREKVKRMKPVQRENYLSKAADYILQLDEAVETGINLK